MRLLCISFLYDNIIIKSKREHSVQQILLLMSRCRKLHHAIMQITIAFKLIDMRSKIDLRNPDEYERKLRIDKRLLSAIKVFLAENKIYPERFLFAKKNLLMALTY